MDERSCTVAVIGGGPAGIAAAVAAASAGMATMLIDEGLRPGGQIWRGQGAAAPGAAGRWLRALASAPVAVLGQARAVARPEPGALLIDTASGACLLRAQRWILCPGARERMLPFPGWTLPGVTGAGGLQALVKDGLPIAGRRVVVAGSGPLLPAVARTLARAGARLVLIAEQAGRAQLAAFAAGLWRHPAKLAQALALWRCLRALRPASWVVRGEGDGRLERVVVCEQGRERTLACDYLACGFGLVPNLELPALLGCALDGERVRVDAWLRTSDPAVLCAGEVLGIGGVDSALVEGRIAGLVAAGRADQAATLLPQRAAARRLAALAERCFALRAELRALPTPGTLLCRCEDVPMGAAMACSSWCEAKRFTRCGMGACQGRICGAAADFLFGWRPGAATRPPLQPVPLAVLGACPPAIPEIRP